ncbi:AAA+ superfamily ATPase [Nanobdella aerobiophila]|uniref:AAA+ superfamily ATPase n=1 Tax=Nanobdella aerobiophila TaxID=2586965 RepID=A0A915SFG5_9ARCH|nr:ATP-binding protein [Nanobdella aerobiophila]BBL45720.1 AAA+ superfamily ATPase [Nanobdella aerobiophila]
MIDKELVKRYILEFQSKPPSNIKKRELNITPIKGKAISIIGPRRVGKTYFLFSLIDNPERYVYIDFENPIFANFKPEDIINIADIFKELYPDKEPIFLLDEVQVIEDWERVVRYLLSKNYYVYITGSSSKLLSKEIATHLRGRTITYNIFNLSFREFLRFKDINFEGKDFYLNYNKIKSLLNEYIKYGGYPEIVLNEDKLKLLQDYLTTVVSRDIIDRYMIKNEKIINEILYFAINNYSKYISYNSLHKLFKQYGKSIHKITIIKYLSYFEDSLLLFLLKKYSKSIKEIIVSPKKVYLIDTGYGIFGNKDISRDMENIIYLELLRKTNINPLLEIYYFKDYQQHEIDFLVKEGNNIKQLIQVSYINNYDEIDKREIRSLLKGYNLFKEYNPELLIITWDYEDNKIIDNINIKFIPLYRWLLNND